MKGGGERGEIAGNLYSRYRKMYSDSPEAIQEQHCTQEHAPGPGETGPDLIAFRQEVLDGVRRMAGSNSFRDVPEDDVFAGLGEG